MTIWTTPFFQKQIKRLVKTYHHAEADCTEELQRFDPERCFALGAGLKTTTN